MARQSKAGFWLVERGEAQWLAWRDWLKAELGRRFFPPRLPVPLEWPPETPDAAAAVADHFRDIRDKARKDKDWPRRRAPETEIPIVPRPWIWWSDFEKFERVRKFSDQDTAPDMGRSPDEIMNLLSSVGRMPKHRRSPSIGPGPDTPPLPFKMPAPRDDIAAIRKQALERKLREMGTSYEDLT